jgi:hypothetical protein
MDERKAEGASDLLHEFDPVDARHVIRIVIDNAGAHVEPLDSQEPELEPRGDELPDEMSSIRLNPAEGEPGNEDSPGVEQCEEQCHEDLDPPGVKTKKKPPDKAPGKDDKREPPTESAKEATHLMRMRKLAGILDDQCRQAALAFEDRFGRLDRRFRRVYGPSYAAFEKDAMAECGDAFGVAVLNLLRGERGLGPLEPTVLEKTAALVDHHISEESPELEMFEQLTKMAREAADLQKSLSWVKSQCME